MTLQNMYLKNRALTDFNGISPSDSVFVVGDGTKFVGESGNVVLISLGLGGVSLSNNDAGTSNTILGKNAAASLDAGSDFNTFIGENVSDAAMNDSSGNVGIGYAALSALTTGDDNVAVGKNALLINSTGARSTVIGFEAGKNTTGANNTLMGYQAGVSITVGTNNCVLGVNALTNGGAGNQNVAIGDAAFLTAGIGSGNIALGFNAGGKAVGGQELYISNQTWASNALEKTNAIIFGVMNIAPASQTLALNAAVTATQSLALSNPTEGGTAKATIQTAHETHTLTLGASSVTTTIDIPTGALLLGASFNVNTAVTDTAGDDSWTAAFSGGDTTALGGGAPTQNTKVDTMIVPAVAGSETNITFTPNGGNFGAGIIEVVAYYIDLTSLANV